MTKRRTPDALAAECTKALAFLDLLEATKAGARHSRSDLAEMQTIHDIAVAQGAQCAAPEPEAKAGLDLSKFKAKAGEAIVGNLGRGTGGKFVNADKGGGAGKPTAKPIPKVAPKTPAAPAVAQAETPDPKANQQKVLGELFANDIGLSPAGLATLGTPPDPDATGPDADAAKRRADAMVTSGLLEKFEDGSYAPTERGKKVKAAYDAGDAKAAQQALPPALGGAGKHVDLSAVKALGEGRVGGYVVRFGSADEPDLSSLRDFFTKDTELWLDHYGLLDGTGTIPMLYEHALDEATKSAPVVGRWTKATIDDVGVWLEGQISTAHAYAEAITQLVSKGLLRLSGDSAPHLVQREIQPTGTNRLVRFPLLGASLTTHAAEPRLTPIGAVKSALGIDDTTDADRGDPARSQDPRARVADLLYELSCT